MANPKFTPQKAKVDDVANLRPVQTVVSVASPFEQSLWESPAPTRASLRSEASYRVLALYAPNPDRPFSQTIWDSATPGRARATGEADGTTNPLLTPNPASPFTQYEWRLTARVQLSLKSESYWGAFPLYSPNPSAPFNQEIWDSAAKTPPKAVGEAVAGDAAVLTPNPAQPFSPVDSLRASLVQKAKGDDFANLLPVQTVVVTVAPFTQTDWPNSGKKPSLTADSYTRLSALLTPNPAQPFGLLDWSRTHVVYKAKVDDFANLLPVQTVVVVLAPFAQEDWPSVAKRPNVAASDVYAGPATLLAPNPSRPFSQGLWDRATRGYPKAANEPAASNVSIFFASLAAPPFSQSDWPNPVNGFATKNGTWINFGLTDGGTPAEPPVEPPVEPPRNDPAGIRSRTWKPGKKTAYRSYRFYSKQEIEELTGPEIRQAARDLRADVRNDPLAEEVEKEAAALARMVDVLATIDRLESSVAELSRAIEFATEQKAKAEAEARDDDDTATFLLLS